MVDGAISFTVRLHMLSDWSVSSGGGRQGSIDSLVERDADGLPYVPATTLRGIWRDAAEQVAFALDGGSSGDRRREWMTLVDHLFGSQPNVDDRGRKGEQPIPSRLAVSDVRFPEGFRAALRDGAVIEGNAVRDRSALRAALCFIKPGVAIDSRSGRAKTDFLRFEEVARQGAVLEGAGTLQLSGDQAADKALATLALTSAALVERIGGNRRRGAGRCTMELVFASAPGGLPASREAAIKLIEAAELPKLPEALRLPDLAPDYASATADDDFVIVPLDVGIVTPTVVAKAVLGNVVECLDHIPGTLLLAGVAELLAGLVDRAAIGRAIANGDIRVLPAYPVVAGRRGLPAPLIMERLKDDTNGPGGKGLLRIRPEQHDEQDNAQYKSCRGQFIAFEPGRPAQIAFDSVGMVIRTHNTVQDEVQKPTAEVGGVFTYEALPAGTKLKSELWIRKGLASASALGQLTERSASASIGRAKKAGYGKIELRAAAPAMRSFASAADGKARVALYLCSDLLLPGLPGKDTSVAALLAVAVSEVTGVRVTISGGEARTMRTEGWTARWGLPRPSYVSIRAGSTVFVSAPDTATFSKDSIAMLQREGLGLRRTEGFGQVLVDPEFVTARLDDAGPLQASASARAASNATSAGRQMGGMETFGRLLESSALKDAIRLRAEKVAATAKDRAEILGWTIKKDKSDVIAKPNMSQLGSLRSVMRGLTDQEDVKRADSFLEAISKSDRADKWGKGELSELRKLLTDGAKIWSILGLGEESAFADFALARKPGELTKDGALRRFAVASLLHAAMRAHKRDLENPPKTTNSDRQKAEA